MVRNTSEDSATWGSTSQKSPAAPNWTSPGMGKNVLTLSNSVSSAIGVPGARPCSHWSSASVLFSQRTLAGAGGTGSANRRSVISYPESIDERLAATECVGECKTVNIPQLTAYWNAMGEAGNQDIVAVQAVGNVMSGGFALYRWVGGQNKLGHVFITHP